MTSTSLLPKTAKAAGISFEDLINRIVRNSLEC
jgi:D-alanine-D-alanine ligase-like ATP-grasp enzyme